MAKGEAAAGVYILDQEDEKGKASIEHTAKAKLEEAQTLFKEENYEKGKKKQTGKKEDIVKVILPDSLPQLQGWRLLFVEDWEKAKPIRFSSLVRPGYLRSKKVSLSDEQAEIHLCLYAHRLKGEFAGLVGIGAYPEDASLVATIHWPADTPPNDPVTTQVHLTKRC